MKRNFELPLLGGNRQALPHHIICSGCACKSTIIYTENQRSVYHVIEVGFSNSGLVIAFQGELPDYLQDAIEFRLLLYAAKEFKFYNPEVIVRHVCHELFSLNMWHLISELPLSLSRSSHCKDTTGKVHYSWDHVY